jgi:hypothetical protein
MPESIGRVLDDIPCPPVADIVVDDGQSTDGTAEIEQAHGAHVIVEPRRWHGSACLTLPGILSTAGH